MCAPANTPPPPPKHSSYAAFIFTLFHSNEGTTVAQDREMLKGVSAVLHVNLITFH